MALLSCQQPRCEAEAKGWREACYLSTMRSRCRFFCLSWLFLPACNLRLVWLLSSWALRDAKRTEGHNHQLGSTRSGPVASGWSNCHLLQGVHSESSCLSKASGHKQMSTLGWTGSIFGLQS